MAVSQFYETVLLADKAPLAAEALSANVPRAKQARDVQTSMLEEWESLATLTLPAGDMAAAYRALVVVLEEVDPMGAEMMVHAAPETAFGPSVTSPVAAFAAQLLYEPLIPVERSPLVKRAIADLLAAGSGVSAGLYYFDGQPHLVILAGSVVVLVRNAASFVIDHASPEAGEFVEDVSAATFESLRKRWNIPRKKG